MTRSNELLALVCDACPPALGLSIDREAIHNVILQRTGEMTGALLPQWLSGYAFLFAPRYDVARARQTAAGVQVTLTFSYDREDSLVRAIAERVAVNAMEAGITLRSSDGAAQVRLMRIAIHGSDPAAALADLAGILKIPVSAGEPYEAEREMLAGSRVIPLFHLPHVYQLSPRVKNWPTASGSFADTWLAP
jgi:peptide/nickel transport system substrate-binding protein